MNTSWKGERLGRLKIKLRFATYVGHRIKALTVSPIFPSLRGCSVKPINTIDKDMRTIFDKERMLNQTRVGLLGSRPLPSTEVLTFKRLDTKA